MVLISDRLMCTVGMFVQMRGSDSFNVSVELVNSQTPVRVLKTLSVLDLAFTTIDESK